MPLPPVARSQYCSRLSNVRTPSNASPPTHLNGTSCFLPTAASTTTLVLAFSSLAALVPHPACLRRRLHHRLRRRTRSAPAGERPLRDVPHETQFRGDLPARARRIPSAPPRRRSRWAHPRLAHCYLGMPDARLAVPVADLVPAEDARGYPTNFCAMLESDLNAISLRGEQLARTLLAHYCPAL
jgi:hypothetical protein